MISPQKCKHCNRFTPPSSKLDDIQNDILKKTIAAIMRHNCYDVKLSSDICKSFFYIPVSIGGITEVIVNCHDNHDTKELQNKRQSHANWLSIRARDFEIVLRPDNTIIVNGQTPYIMTELNIVPLFRHLDQIVIDLNIEQCEHI